VLETEVKQFMMQYSLTNSVDHSNINSSDVSMTSPKKCFLVKEANSEYEEEDSEDDIVHNLSSDRMDKLEEVEAVFRPQRQGSVVIDEDGEKFLDCNSEGEEIMNAPEEQTENLKEIMPNEDSNKKLFKMKDTKGKVMYDQATKQKRFMSPFE